MSLPDVQKAAVIAVELLVVVGVLALAGYEIVHAPDSDITKGLVGALTAAFGGIVSHLFSGR